MQWAALPLFGISCQPLQLPPWSFGTRRRLEIRGPTGGHGEKACRSPSPSGWPKRLRLRSFLLEEWHLAYYVRGNESRVGPARKWALSLLQLVRVVE